MSILTSSVGPGIRYFRLAQAAAVVPVTGNGLWTNITNILNDTTGAVTSLQVDSSPIGETDPLNLTGMPAFSIPADATITGVTVRSRGSTDALSTVSCVFQLTLLAVDLSAARSRSFTPSTFTVADVGGPTDTWGLGSALTPAIVNDPDFGVWIYADQSSVMPGHQLDFDWLYMQVHFNLPMWPRSQQRHQRRILGGGLETDLTGGL